MSILSTDLQTIRAAGVSSDPAGNGGRPGTVLMPQSAKNNAFPDVDDALLETGGSRWRKLFLVNLNAENLEGLSPEVLIDSPPTDGDFALFCAGDWDEYESALTGNETIYSSALLSADAAAGATSITVTLGNAALAPMLSAGRRILISTRTLYWQTTSTAGAEEYCTCQSVSISGTQATITLSSPLTNAYATANKARISTVYQPGGEVKPTITNWAESGSGHYDAASYPVLLNNRGTIRQNWTITYTSATAFELRGDTLGLLGTYQTTADASPPNTNAYAGGQPYFVLPAGGHGAEHAAGDTITFRTYPAAIPIWVKQVFPAHLANYKSSKMPVGWSVGSPQ